MNGFNDSRSKIDQLVTMPLNFTKFVDRTVDWF